MRSNTVGTRGLTSVGLIAITLLVSSCSASAGGSSGRPTAPAAASPIATVELSVAPTAVSTAPARPSAGCSAATATALTAGATTQTIAVGTTQRTYRRYLPDDGKQGPRPVVINLHGLTSNIDQQVAITAFEPLAATQKFIVLTPQGLGSPTSWSFADTPDNADVAFIGAMLNEVEATTCVDMARVYSTGLSDGGIMSSLLACLMSDRIAAVGLVSGIVHPASCNPGRPVPMMVFWGEKDVVLPFCGGLGPVVAALISGKPAGDAAAPTCPPTNLNGFPPVEQVVGTWASTDGCAPTPHVVQAGSDVEERIFGGCHQQAAIRFFVVSDGGHTWPGSKVMEALSGTPAGAIIGHTTDQIDATRLIWAFFQGYALGSP